MLIMTGGFAPSPDSVMLILLFVLLWVGLTATTTSRPYIMNHPQNMTVVEGQRVLFNCGAEAFPDNITYYWYKDGTDVRLLPVYMKRLSLQGDGKLLITGVVKEDMGWYTCRPSNGIGQDEANAYLNVIYYPKVLVSQMPSQVTWAKGFREKLDCPVDSNPPLISTMWAKGQTVIDSKSRFDVLLNGTLLVSLVAESDAGFYSCTPSNAMGSGVASPNVQVLVKDPPYFTRRPEALYQRLVQQAVVFPCEAGGTPVPAITWRKVGSNLDLTSDTRIVQVGGHLNITSTIKDDHGQYECVASNVIATIVSPTELWILNTTPHAPYNVTVSPGLFDATVSWAPANDGGKPQFYMVWFRQIGDSWNALQLPAQSQSTSYTVYQLQPDTLYEFMVLSRNEYGNGSFSDSVRARTLGYQAGLATALPVDSNGNSYYPNVTKPIGPQPTPARNVTAKLMTDGTVQLNWLPSLHAPVPVFWYTVDFREKDSRTQVWKTYDGRVLPQEQGTRVNMKLEPGSYEVRVIAYGVLSFSVPSNIVAVTIPAKGGLIPDALIGGIVGGVLFLLVAVLLTTMAIIHSRRKDTKARNADVSYGKPEDMNSLQQTPPKWDRWQQNGGGDIVTSLSNTDSIFFLPRSGGRHPYPTSDPAMTSERGHVDFDERDPLYRRDLGYQVAGAPALFNASEPHPPGYYPESHNSPFTYQGSNPMFFNDTFPQTAGGTHHQPRPRSRSQPNQGSSSRRFPSDPNDPRSPKPTNLSQGHQQEYLEHPGPYRERAATAPRDPSPPHHHPGFQFIMQAPPPYKKSSGGSSGTLPVKPSDTLDEPSPQSFDGTLGDLEGRPGAGGRSHYDGPLRDRSRGDFHRPQMPDEPQRGYDAAFRRVPEQVPQNGYDGPFQSFQSEEDDDVFPSPLSHFPSRQPTFPRHSSMKPGAQQTYLTGGRGVENEGPPGLTLSDISSVLDPPADQSATLPVPLPPPRPSWQPSQESSRSFPLPSTYSTDASQEALEPSTGDTGRGSQRSRERDRPLARMWPSSKPLADDSSDSSGRPLGYTRDQLHDVVDRLRQAPRSRSAPDSQPGERYLDVSAGGMIPGVNGGYRGEGSGHPGSWLFGEDSTSSGLGSRNTSHSAGSLRPKPPDRAGNSQPYTDNSYAGNSLSSLAIPSSFSLVGDDTTPSSTSQPFSRPPSSSNRRDTSTDENYEFDHLPALESDILDDLQRYSRLAGSRQASGLEGGQHFGNSSSPDAVMRELYPQPRKQSQYSDAAERFERLREEFQQFRHQQASSPPYSGTSRHPDHYLPHQNQQPLYPMDSEML